MSKLLIVVAPSPVKEKPPLTWQTLKQGELFRWAHDELSGECVRMRVADGYINPLDEGRCIHLSGTDLPIVRLRGTLAICDEEAQP